jgi:diamine N-acetyltransferase
MILGNDIRLRALEKEDLPRCVAWLNDPEVTAGLQITTPLSLLQEEAWFERILKHPVEEQPLAIEVLLKGTWTHIGIIGFDTINWQSRCAEVGIFIGEKSFWNQGWGTRAMRLMLKHAFNTLNLNRVKLFVYETNQRAIQSYKKAGFIEEGRMRQERFLNGQYVNTVFMGILRNEWQDAD